MMGTISGEEAERRRHGGGEERETERERKQEEEDATHSAENRPSAEGKQRIGKAEGRRGKKGSEAFPIAAVAGDLFPHSLFLFFLLLLRPLA